MASPVHTPEWLAARKAILALADEGMTYRQIATRLGVSKNVVARSIYALRQFHERAGASLPRKSGRWTPEGPGYRVPRYTLPPPQDRQCRWIDGDPGTKAAKWCEGRTLIGRSFCEAHHARVYREDSSLEAA